VTIFIRLALAAAITALCATAALAAPKAQGIAKGFGATTWGEDLAKREGFMKLRTQDGVDYYVSLRERYELAGSGKVTVYYGVVSGRLYAAHLRLGAGADMKALTAELSKLYGKPKSSLQEGATVSRWKVGQVRVKLKAPQDGEGKLSFYFQPVAAAQIAALREADFVGEDITTLLPKDAQGVKGPTGVMPKGPADQVGIDVLRYLQDGSKLLRLEKPASYQ